MTKLVGILNITPDSFFDGKKYYQEESALRQLEVLLAHGADAIDIGAESTRPGAIAISYEEEWQRLKNILPQVIKYIQNYNQINHRAVEISLDSRHFQNVARALDLGIDIINDVSGFENEEMTRLAVQSGKKIVVMHNLGIPANKNIIISENLDVTKVLMDWMKNKLQKLQKSGVKKEQIIFDIGVGFGKNAQQSIKLLQEIDRLRALDLPLYVGYSNKSFLDELKDGAQLLGGRVGFNFRSREDKTLIISVYLAGKNIEYLRVHDIQKNKLAIKGFGLEL